jgi:transcriptional regulator with XRE-family HTH domain
MDDVRVGRLIRLLRVKRQWRQVDLAKKAGVSRGLISMLERGHVRHTNLLTLIAVVKELEATVDVSIRWRGGQVDRLMNVAHAQLHEEIARFLDDLGGWLHVPEVSFSIYGERGVIDILAFHHESGSLLVVELKTELTSIEDLLSTMDRRVRLAARIAAERGWRARLVSAWVAVAASDANQARIATHRATLRSAFPADGRHIRRWLRSPSGTIRALSTWAKATRSSATRGIAPRQRVRAPGRPLRQHG